MDSIDALAKAIKEFEGGVVIVSHDFRSSTLKLFAEYSLDIIFRIDQPSSWWNLGSCKKDDQEFDEGRPYDPRLQEKLDQAE